MRTISARAGVSLLATCVMQASAADPAVDPWMLLTQRDLQAIHDTLAANHPGPVDPQSDRYRRRLEDGLQVAKAEAARARQYSDYTRALRRYVNGFRDGHTTARFLLSSSRGRVSWWGATPMKRFACSRLPQTVTCRAAPSSWHATARRPSN